MARAAAARPPRSARRQRAHRFQDGVMFNRRCHNVTFVVRDAVCGETEDCEVVALGGAAREDDVAARCIHDGGDLMTRPFDGAPRPAAECMSTAAGVAEVDAEI